MSVVENGATVLRDQHGVAADVVTNGEKPAHVGQAAQRHNEAGGTAAGGAAGAAGGVSVTNAAGAAAAAAAASSADGPAAPQWLRLATVPGYTWDASLVRVGLNVRLDGARVPLRDDRVSTRVDKSHLVVLDNFFSEDQRQGLMAILEPPDWVPTKGPDPARWERKTCDSSGLPPTWGLKPMNIRALTSSPPRAVLEIQSRLAALYPEFDIFHMPDYSVVDKAPGGVAADPFIANAPVYGDCFQWHFDADPLLIPAHGHTNREPGRSYFVTLLLYPNQSWPRAWDAETLFLDLESDTGVFVRPKPYRAVLMDQDVTHRLCTPSMQASGRPRYSLVWKLIFRPRDRTRDCSIARPEWGAPIDFGTAATVNDEP
eukprot:m.285193 g.285193  ORF g.285193 m.285193 type:complete len:372 (-) comp19430_c6_seq14:237-1352(-)